MKVTVKVIIKSRVRVIRVLALITLTLSVCACKDRCEKAKEDALLQYRDPKLIGLWRYNDNFIAENLPATDSGYINFGNDAKIQNASDKNSLRYSGTYIWGNTGNTIIETGCAQGFPAIDSSLKYEFKGDTLFLLYYNIVAYPNTGGYPCEGIKMVKVL